MPYVVERMFPSSSYAISGTSSWVTGATTRSVMLHGSDDIDHLFDYDGVDDTWTHVKGSDWSGEGLYDPKGGGTTLQRSRSKKYFPLDEGNSYVGKCVSHTRNTLLGIASGRAYFRVVLTDPVNGTAVDQGIGNPDGISDVDEFILLVSDDPASDTNIELPFSLDTSNTAASDIVKVGPDLFLMVGFVCNPALNKSAFLCAKWRVTDSEVDLVGWSATVVEHAVNCSSVFNGPPVWGSDGSVSWWTRDDAGTDVQVDVAADGNSLTIDAATVLGDFELHDNALVHLGSSAYDAGRDVQKLDTASSEDSIDPASRETLVLDSTAVSEIRSWWSDVSDGLIEDTITNITSDWQVYLNGDRLWPHGSFMNEQNSYYPIVAANASTTAYPYWVKYVYVPPVVATGGYVYGPACAGQAILPQGSGHTLEIDQTTLLPVIRDSNGDVVTLVDNSSPVPGACDAPVMLVARERLLYVYYGGTILTSYLIPETVWDALPAFTQTYLGYVDKATGDPVNGPEGSGLDVPRPVGYSFQVGGYRASIGSRPFLWVWAQDPDRKKDILVTGSSVAVVETPTQDQIDAADKAVLGGRNGQPYLTNDEAYAAVVASGNPRIVEAVVEAADPPAVPTGLTISVTDDTVAVSWDVVADTRYAVYLSTAEYGAYTRTVWAAGDANFGTVGGGSYWVKVAAIDLLDQEGGATPLASGVYPLPDLTPPLAPANPTATVDAGALSEQITFSWDAAVDADHYRAYTATTATGPWSQARTVDGLSTVYKSLQYDTTYFFQVLAVDASGNISPRTTAVSDTTVGAVVPTGLATESDFEEVALSWDAASYDEVEVFYSDVSDTGPWTSVATTTGSTYTVTGLTNDTQYWFTLVARYGGEFSDYVTAVSETPAGVPPATDSGNMTFRLLPETLTVADSDPVTVWQDVVSGLNMEPTGTVDFVEDYFAAGVPAVHFGTDGMMIGEDDFAFVDTYSAYFVIKSGNTTTSRHYSLGAYAPAYVSANTWIVAHIDGTSRYTYLREGTWSKNNQDLEQPADINHLVAITSDSPGESDSTQVWTNTGQMGDSTISGTFTPQATGYTMSLFDGAYRAEAWLGEVRYYNVYHDSTTRDAIIAEMSTYHDLTPSGF